MKKLFVSVSIVLSLFSELSAADVMDIYSAKGSSCYENTTYQYHYDTLNYACIVTDIDGSQKLNVNGKIDPRYKNVSEFSYSPTGILSVIIKNGTNYTAIIGNYTSPQSQVYPSIIFDMNGNYSLTYQDLQGKYHWIYNGTVINTSLPPFFYLSNFWSRIIFMEGYYGTTDYWYYYEKIYLDGKRILSDYSKIIYAGNYYRGKMSVQFYIAQKWENIEVITLSPTGTIKKLLTVKGTFDLSKYTYNTVRNNNFQKFAFVLQKEDKYYIVTEKGVMPTAYTDIQNLMYYGPNLFATVLSEDGKYGLLVNQKMYGPYESIGQVTPSQNMKSWSVMIKKDNRDYIIINGKENPI